MEFALSVWVGLRHMAHRHDVMVELRHIGAWTAEGEAMTTLLKELMQGR